MYAKERQPPVTRESAVERVESVEQVEQVEQVERVAGAQAMQRRWVCQAAAGACAGVCSPWAGQPVVERADSRSQAEQQVPLLAAQPEAQLAAQESGAVARGTAVASHSRQAQVHPL